MAEPLGAIIAYLLLRPYLNTNIFAYVFAIAFSVMVYISFDELLPACYRDEYGHRAILEVVAGMMIVSLSLLFL